MTLSIQTFAQLQYVSVPRSGEGRFARSSKAVFWVNPIFLKPSVFFSSEGMNLRADRKWWRTPHPSPVFIESDRNLLRETALTAILADGVETDFMNRKLYFPTLMRYELLMQAQSKAVNEGAIYQPHFQSP